jgi:hypothetical protein
MRRHEAPLSELGRGSSWEEALADAERRQWRAAHPFNLSWREYCNTLFLRAECDRCRITTEHRLRVRQPFTADDWLTRAETAERALVARLQKDGRWAPCGHRGDEVWPVRAELERVAKRPAGKTGR